jgi:hypothetical protein
MHDRTHVVARKSETSYTYVVEGSAQAYPAGQTMHATDARVDVYVPGTQDCKQDTRKGLSM